MFEECLILCSLLLALYGLSCLIANFALWLTTPKRGGRAVYVVVLRPGDPLAPTLRSAMERLHNGGLGPGAQVVALDGGLTPDLRRQAEDLCHSLGATLTNEAELPQLLKFPSFQTDQNQV